MSGDRPDIVDPSLDFADMDTPVQPTLGDIAPPVNPGSKLEEGYTPDWAAEMCLRSLGIEADGPMVPPLRVAEVHVGGGAWTRASQKVWGDRPPVLACDINPAAPGLNDHNLDEAIVGDVLDPQILRQIELWRPDLVIGNPPFSHALEHMSALRTVLPFATIAWVLPWSTPALVGWAPYIHGPRSLLEAVGPFIGRVWPDINVRDTGFFVFSPDGDPRGPRFLKLSKRG